MERYFKRSTVDSPTYSSSTSTSGSKEEENYAAGSAEGDAVPTPSAAADEALRVAMAAAEYESLARALEEHCALASEGMLVEARADMDKTMAPVSDPTRQPGLKYRLTPYGRGGRVGTKHRGGPPPSYILISSM